VEQVLLRRKDAAGVVSVSLPTLDKLIRQGQVKAIRVGRAVLIPRSSLERFAGQRTPVRRARTGSLRKSAQT